MRHSILAASLLAAALSLAGSQSMPPQASQAGAPTAPVEAEAGASGSVADDNLNAVLWVQTSAEYRAAAETVSRQIGSASGRASVTQYVYISGVPVTLKKKKPTN